MIFALTLERIISRIKTSTCCGNTVDMTNTNPDPQPNLAEIGAAVSNVVHK
jgi:hypothetical protein